jgi:2-dehydro-3-deoxyphosphogluconate aldolase/(4S)-4-hydroxy-2-oxoglutarate aldolase
VHGGDREGGARRDRRRRHRAQREDAQDAKSAGCRFAVSPGYVHEIGIGLRDIGLPLLPGVSTGSEVMQANIDGYRFLKFFPATAPAASPC